MKATNENSRYFTVEEIISKDSCPPLEQPVRNHNLFDLYCFRHASEKASLIKELDNLKELLHTYEQSLERKDSIISNLTNAVYRQRDKIDLMRNFCNWRIQHNDAKREVSLLGSEVEYKYNNDAKREVSLPGEVA